MLEFFQLARRFSLSSSPPIQAFEGRLPRGSKSRNQLRDDEEWIPAFADYLFVSFTNASAFSPTDTMPLTVRVKMLMLAQGAGSVLTLVMVASRAVNVI